MSKFLKAIYYFLVLVVVSVSIASCSGSNQKSSKEESLFKIKTRDPATITFCFMGYGTNGQPYNLDSINEMLAELNKKTVQYLNTTIKFKWLPYENYDAKLIELLKSGDGPDAFFTHNLQELLKEGLIKDITDLFPQLAPNYYTLLKESWGDEIKYTEVDKKIYGVLNNGIFLPQYFIIAMQDMVEKYAPDGIKNFEDYGKFMQAVKDNEKNMIPGCAFTSDIIDAYLQGNGYFSVFGTGFYSSWSAKEMTPIPIEKTEAFKTACMLYKQWKEKDFLVDTESQDYSYLIKNGQLVSMLLNGMQIHNMSFPANNKYRLYPLYMDSTYQIYRSYDSIGINTNSKDPERVLMFIEWLQSSQENYDLLQYGILDKNYKLTGNSLDISDIDYNNIINNWWGSNFFRNYINERPYPFEPENYKGFLEKCLNNTLTTLEIYEKFGYDPGKYLTMSKDERSKLEEDQKKGYDKINDLLQKRNSIYYDFMKQMNAGNFSKSFSEMIEEQVGESSTDMLVEFYKSSMDAFKK